MNEYLKLRPEALSLMTNKWATVKAGTQERGTERGTDVMWFYTGNYTEMMQEVMINGSFPAAASCNSTASPAVASCNSTASPAAYP